MDALPSYSEMGARLEHDCDPYTLALFARHYGESTDPVLRQLAAYALFMSTAKCERLAGRITVAALAEARAESIYGALPEGARW